MQKPTRYDVVVLTSSSIEFYSDSLARVAMEETPKNKNRHFTASHSRRFALETS